MKAAATAFALALALVPGPALAAGPDPDPWLGEDKALHFSLSAGLAGAGYGAAALVWDERWIRLTAGAGLSLGLGGAKELADLAGAGDPSIRDFTWDVLGCATGLAVSLGLDWLITELGGRDGALGYVLDLPRR